MSIFQDKLEKQLKLLIEKGKSFAAYRLPLQYDVKFIAQLDGSPLQFHDLSDLNGKDGFVISPFKIDKNFPIVLIRPDLEVEGIGNIVEALDRLKIFDCDSASTDEGDFDVNLSGGDEYQVYKESFTRFIQPLKNGEFKKLVLSRYHRIEKPLSFSFVSSFFKALESYPHMMSYVCYTPQTGLWMGSTPEILLSGNAEKWHTVALAGTQKVDEVSGLEIQWDSKNIEEQEIVSEYIRSIVGLHTSQIEEKGAYTVQAGNVAHLKTEFSFQLDNANSIGDLLHELHPTPAVCGFPKQEAWQFINENEQHARQYYSGIIGRLDPNRETNLYVNLRCAKIENSFVTLYAGGGIMATSTPESEWEETNYKMQTLLKVL